MFKLVGVNISEKIAEDSTTLVYRGDCEQEERQVLLKVSNRQYPSPTQISDLENEYEITRLFSSDQIIRTISLREYQNSKVLLFEDSGARPLTSQKILLHNGLPFFLKLSISITKALAEIHARNVIHNGIRPANIFYNPINDQIQITNFSKAVCIFSDTDKCSTQAEGGADPAYTGDSAEKHLNGNSSLSVEMKLDELRYCSPEYTGRISQDVSKSSDLYSLGVTLYELLTGQLPFSTEDHVQLVHAHLARKPAPPHELDSEIPQGVSGIILKLLEKYPDNRYGSCLEVVLDLEHCLTTFEQQGGVASFEPGIRRPPLMESPHLIIGRRGELHQLNLAYDKARASTTQLVLVSGSSGTGKTALVQKFQNEIRKKPNLFLTGKFDQYQLDIPYFPLIECLREFTRIILTKDREEVAQWKRKIRDALAGNGQVILDFIPELGLIIGPQPSVPTLDPAETKNRFKRCLRNLIGACASEELPLILFLDDMQWADSATLKLVELFFNDPEIRALLVVGAYRSNEIEPGQSLELFLNRLNRKKKPYHSVMLEDLALIHVTQYLSHILPIKNDLHARVAEICWQKTNGNPFFLKQFIRTLFNRGYIFYNAQIRRWDLDIARIQSADITDNVVSHIIERVYTLPPACQKMLSFASCIGNTFDKMLLTVVTDSTSKHLQRDIRAAEKEGFLLESLKNPLSTGEGYAGEDGAKTLYKFAHDQIQQAIYLKIARKDREKIHLHIGRKLLQLYHRNENSQLLYTTVGQLNQGRSCIRSREELYHLAELNLQAGRKALANVAYGLASDYFKKGLRCLDQEKWCENHYSLYLDLHVNGAEAFYLNGDFNGMRRIVSLVEKHGANLLDKIKVYDIEIQAFIAQNMLNEAIDKSLFALRLLGEDLPENPGKLQLGIAYIQTRWSLLGKKPEDILNLPKMSDPHKLAAMRILYRIGTPAYYRGAEFLALLACKTVQLSLKYGNTTYSAAIGYATLAILQCGVIGDIKNGYDAGLVALNMQDRFVPNSILPSSQYIFANLIQHWREHLRETLIPLQRAYHSGLEIGETEHAALALYSYNNRLYLLGRELTEVAREMARARVALEQIGQEIMISRQRLAQQAVENLLSHQDHDSPRFSGIHYDEEKLVAYHLKSGDKTTIFQLHIFKLIQGYLLGQLNFAMTAASEAQKYSKSGMSSAFLPQLYFYASLTMLALYPDVDVETRARFRKRIAGNQKKLAKWARHAPMNFLHLHNLVEAERARCANQREQAAKLYDTAIKNANENGYLQNEALAYELAGEFHYEGNMQIIGESYLREGYFRYIKWGAVAISRRIQAKYPHLLNLIGQRPEATPQDPSTPVEIDETLSSLDLRSMIKASRAIGSEIQLKNVLESMLKIMIENAGAEKGFLFLEEKGSWKAEIQGEMADDKLIIHYGVEETYAFDLPLPIVNYVARTGNNVVLENGEASEDFGNDPYVLANSTKSLYCTPILSAGKTICILFLENNLIGGTFSLKRKEMLNHLGYQAAISLRNALLYDELEKTVERMNHEIQEHQVTRQQLLHSEKLSAMGRLTASIAHEFGNPLLGINFLLADLKESGKLDEHQMELINTGINECERLQTLIQKLRSVHRPTTGIFELCSIEAILHNSLSFHTKLLISSNIKLDCNFHLDLPMVNVVKDQLTQVIINLILNALDAMKDSGGVLSVATSQEDKFVYFTIADTGKGIPPEDRKRIFEPFYSTKPDIEGSGLGLSVSYGIISNHKGEITVDSTPGLGSTFKVSLPIS